MNNEPVAWLIQTKTAHQFTFKEPTIIPLDAAVIPFYAHPHPDNLGLAESIIKQQQLEIDALKDEVAQWKMSYENSIRFEDGYGHN
jgi:hypothetical protein